MEGKFPICVEGVLQIVRVQLPDPTGTVDLFTITTPARRYDARDLDSAFSCLSPVTR